MTHAPRPTARTVGLLAVVALVAGCSGSGPGPDPADGGAGLTATPSAHCASDHGQYDGLRAYLAEEAASEPWVGRVAVCAGGTIEVDVAAGDGADASREAIEVCEVAAGYLITNPPPPERAGAPNPREVGIIVTDTDGSPVALGAEDELSAVRGGDEEAEREEREREREREREGEQEAAAERGDGSGAEAAAREPEPFRCFDPFA